MKKIVTLILLTIMMMSMTSCSNSGGNKSSGWSLQKTFTYNDISKWQAMKTPNEGSGSGSVIETNTTDKFTTIKAADDGWGGVESDYFEIDLEKDPMILIQIFENPDNYKWGLKLLPENPISDHEWGLYLVPDNNLKWNKYAGVDVKSTLGEDFIAIYGTKIKAKLWVYAAGGNEGTVSVSEIKLVNTK